MSTAMAMTVMVTTPPPTTTMVVALVAMTKTAVA